MLFPLSLKKLLPADNACLQIITREESLANGHDSNYSMLDTLSQIDKTVVSFPLQVFNPNNLSVNSFLLSNCEKLHTGHF